jgi:hypothetical protein
MAAHHMEKWRVMGEKCFHQCSLPTKPILCLSRKVSLSSLFLSPLSPLALFSLHFEPELISIKSLKVLLLLAVFPKLDNCWGPHEENYYLPS